MTLSVTSAKKEPRSCSTSGWTSTHLRATAEPLPPASPRVHPRRRVLLPTLTRKSITGPTLARGELRIGGATVSVSAQRDN